MIHIKTKIITPLLAIVLFAFTTGCSRPAKNYSNSIIQQFTSLSEALAAFSSSTNYYITFSETASAVAATNRVLYENLRYVRENCLLDIKKMTPEEFAKPSWIKLPSTIICLSSLLLTILLSISNLSLMIARVHPFNLLVTLVFTDTGNEMALLVGRAMSHFIVVVLSLAL